MMIDAESKLNMFSPEDLILDVLIFSSFLINSQVDNIIYFDIDLKDVKRSSHSKFRLKWIKEGSA